MLGEDTLFQVDDDLLPKWERENPYVIEDIIRFIGTVTIHLHEENKSMQEQIAKMNHPIRWLGRKIKKKVNKESFKFFI